MDDAYNTKILETRRDVRCPVCGSLIGRYDARTGLINTVFYCRKCKMEYAFTIPPKKKP